jgi:serine/threonine protein kinase
MPPSTPDHPDPLTSILRDALRLPAAARPGFLADRCGSDAQLRKRVEELLARQETATLAGAPTQPDSSAFAGSESDVRTVPGSTGARERSGPGSEAAVPPPSGAEPTGRRTFGPYVLGEILGEGGMGVVYLAEQQKPKRVVALKVVRPGLLTPAFLRRFDLETEVLARLQHPGIARIYEAGSVVENGVAQPYFAMEYVRGEELTEFARRHAPGVPAKLELFLKVCDAVSHAHQRGVIHRDLKPGNIVVRAADDARAAGEAQPTILDFGVARASESDMRATLATSVGQIVGTIPYMSPEQVSGKPDEIDVRSDVYSLGVVLFELLTGRLPLDVGGRSVYEASRIITQNEPAPLSSFDASLRGDLQTIVQKALEKEKARRYQSASDLAADLRRYLADEPILARPATTAYQLAKFAKRNKGLVAAAGGVCAVLILGVAGTTWQAVRATAAEVVAEKRRIEAEEQTRAAVKSAERARAVTSFMQRAFSAADPEKAGPDVRVADMLDSAAQQAGVSFADDPETLGAVRSAIGGVYAGIGVSDKAVEQFEVAAEVLGKALGQDHEEAVMARSELGNALKNSGKYDQAEAVLKEVLDTRTRVLGPDNDATLVSRYNLGVLHGKQGRDEGTLDELRGVLKDRERLGKADNEDAAVVMSALAGVIAGSATPGEAEDLYKRAIAIHERISGADSLESLNCRHSYVTLLHILNRYDEALEMAEKLHASFVRLVGPLHPDTQNACNTLAELYRIKARFADSERLHRSVYDAFLHLLGPDNPKTMLSAANLAATLGDEEKYEEAEKLNKDVLERRTRVLGPTHFDTLLTAGHLAILYQNTGRYAEAAPLHRQVLKGRLETLGPEHQQTLVSRSNLAFALNRSGQLGEAKEQLDILLGTREKLFGKEHAEVALTLALLGDNAYRRKEYAEAEAYLRRCIAIREKALGPTHPTTMISKSSLGEALTALGKFEEAEPLIVEGQKAVEADVRAPTWAKVMVLERAVKLYEAWGKDDKAVAYRQLLEEKKAAK